MKTHLPKLFLAVACFAVTGNVACTQNGVTTPQQEQITVDQFGWRADAPRKVAVFADPQEGQNAPVTYVPGMSFELRKASDGSTVFTGALEKWRNGEVHKVSGDRVWWGDFSSFKTPGEYYIYDPQNKVRSHPFRIGNDVFNGVLKTSLRTFYYQRCGVAIDAKHGGNWTHAACHIGPNQDKAAQLRLNDQAAGQPRDVSGGWHDAGDHNKYVSFTSNALWDMMMAYEFRPQVWDDKANIPESGNGVPDILDEIKWELDWLLKMQRDDGAVFNRVTALSYDNGSGPDNDTQARFYTPVTTWSTATLAAATAHGARLFKPFDKAYPGYAARLQNAATEAWEYLEKNPSMLPTDGKDGAGKTASAPGESNTKADRRLRVYAAAQLFKTTGDARYHNYFRQHYKNKAESGDSNMHPLEGAFDASVNPELNRAYVVYATTPNADKSIVQEIHTGLKNGMDWAVASSYTRGDDPYRAFMYDGHYTWGSNSLKASWANLALMAIELNIAPQQNDLYREVAEEYAHYFHGRNPLGWVYLSNMGDKGAKLGAEKSVMDLYHGWFNTVPRYKATGEIKMAPGFLAGGPNQFFSKDWVKPPFGEPPMKAYRDWSGGWNSERNDNEDSWAVTEPAIYYQAAYTLLLSYFSTPPAQQVEATKPATKPASKNSPQR